MNSRLKQARATGQSLEEGGSESPASGAGKSSPRGLIFSPQLAIYALEGHSQSVTSKASNLLRQWAKIRPLSEEFPTPDAFIVPSVQGLKCGIAHIFFQAIAL